MGTSIGEQKTDLFSAAFASSPDMMTISSLDTGEFLEVNEAFIALSGFSRPEILGKTADELGFWATAGDRKAFLERLEREGEIRELEGLFRFKGGEMRRLELSAAISEYGGVACILVIGRDVTERARLLAELGKAKFLLERAEEMAKIGSWEFDYATKKVEGSEGAARIYGVPRGDLSVEAMEAVPLPEYRQLMNKARDEHIVYGKPYDIEFKIHRQADGAILDIHSKALWDGSKRRLFGIIRDVTEEKRTEAGFLQAIAERETLIHELNHRTNNTLQLILSLLKLEELRSPKGEVSGIVERMSRRIGAIALVHGNLYGSRDLARVELEDFILSLSADLLGMLDEADRPRMEYALENVSLVLDAAVPCGIVIEELVDNALTHAYPRGKPGIVRIAAHRDSEGFVEISVQDEGVGLDAETASRIASEKVSNQGLFLVRSLGVGQLHGELSFSGGPGCRCCLRFRDSLLERRIQVP